MSSDKAYKVPSEMLALKTNTRFGDRAVLDSDPQALSANIRHASRASSSLAVAVAGPVESSETQPTTRQCSGLVAAVPP